MIFFGFSIGILLVCGWFAFGRLINSNIEATINFQEAIVVPVVFIFLPWNWDVDEFPLTIFVWCTAARDITKASEVSCKWEFV